ncbi:MAG: carboxypeptidase-like regulatory domain-containing protein [Gemmatimonadota bacterium]|nr:carboxypeptidase-like regulatory domain-containing protein [Gemmatimonadota bacterium]
MTRRPITIAVSVALTGLVSVSCGETGPTVVGSFTLSGTVTDSRMPGLAIPGAAVRLEEGASASTNTDSIGRYLLSGVPGGKVRITVSAPPSYRRETVEVDVRADQTVDIGLAHTGEPPFSGTVWVTPEILGPDDPSSFGSVTYTGRGWREIFDRRANAWITVNAYLFDVRFGERTVEWQFNPEFGSAEAAEAEIEVFGPAMGRLPAALLSNLQEVEVNAGQGAFGGNSYNGSILIHTEDPGTRRAVNDGFLEEVFMHEGAHASLDPDHSDSPGWRAAQQADGVAISDYAHDFPDREDVAETILPYFAVRYRPERLNAQVRWLMTRTTPNRLAYFDGEDLDMSPYTPPPPIAVAPPATGTPPARWDTLRFEDPPIPPRRNRR